MISTIIALAVIGAASAKERLIVSDPSTRMFRDTAGRARIFHGTNVVFKGPPYIPIQDKFDPHLSLSDKDL